MGRVTLFLTTRLRFLLLLSLCVIFSSLALVWLVRAVITPDAGLLRYEPEAILLDGRLVYSPTTPSSAPTAAGVVPGQDAILAVDRHGIASSHDLVRAAQGITRFSPYLLTVMHPHGGTVTFEVAPWFRPMRPEWICEIVFCLSLAFMAFALSWRLPLEPFTPPLVLAALLMLVFTAVMPFSFNDVPTNALANAGNISSWLLVVFAALFPWKRGKRSIRVAGLVLLLSAYGVFCAWRTTVFSFWMSSGEEQWLTLYKRLGGAIIVSDATAYVALGTLLASAYVRARIPRDRQMLQWLLAGFLLAVPPYFFMNQLPLILGEATRSIGLGSVSLLLLSILPVFLLIALTRRQELDIRRFLARYCLYATLLVIMVALFAVVFIPLKTYMENAYRLASPMPELFASGLILLFLLFLRIPVDRIFDPKRRIARPTSAVSAPSASEVDRTMSEKRLADLRMLFSGISRALSEPATRLAAGAELSIDKDRERAAADLLHFARTLDSVTGGAPAIRGEVDIASLAFSAVCDARSRHPAVSFVRETSASARLRCYPEELGQAIAAVLDNAAEAAASRDARVELRTVVTGERIVIEISDNGPGLSAILRRKLFQPFFTTKPGHQGLGLYIARMLVERNGGQIEPSRGSSTGATVRIAFPAIVAPPTKEKQSV